MSGWAERLPTLPGAQRAVRRFMPGEHVEDALAAADTLQAAGIGVLFTHLGEALTDLAEADAVAAHYHDVIERSRQRAMPIEVSVKPTQLGMGLDDEACHRHAVELAQHAAEAGTWLWLDMEGSALAGATIDLYEQLKADHPKVGIALQAYLKRTASDIQRLLPLEPAIRLGQGCLRRAGEPSPTAPSWRSTATTRRWR